MLITHAETGQSADVAAEQYDLIWKIRGWEPADPGELVTAEPTEHTVAEVLDSVGNDPERAAAALEAEKAGKNRTTLIAALERITTEALAANTTEEP